MSNTALTQVDTFKNAHAALMGEESPLAKRDKAELEGIARNIARNLDRQYAQDLPHLSRKIKIAKARKDHNSCGTLQKQYREKAALRELFKFYI